MKCGVVYYREIPAGVLGRFNSGRYEFRYLKNYRERMENPAVSAILPKSQAVFSSKFLFAYFAGILAEGAQKIRQCRLLNIDEQDSFSRLLATSSYDAIGAFSVRPRIKRKVRQ